MKKILEIIQKNKSFLITAHVNLEGDALGSELAMYQLLKKLNKRVTIYNNDVTPGIYKFLPYSRVIKNSLNNGSYDVAMVLDCSDSSRAGKVRSSLVRAKRIANIDHHVSNTYFGDLNWVDPNSGSTCQMLYRLCEKFKIMDKRIALCLYTGMFTDTGNFTYANVDSETHRIVSNLMKYNLHPHKIYDSIHSLCTPTDLDFMGKIISSLKFSQNKKICWSTISKWNEGDYDLTEVIFSIMRLLREAEVFLLFRRVGKNKTRINFRSRSKVDVNRVAKFFGGGGHKRASGTTLEDNLEQAEKKVVEYIERHANSKRFKSKNSKQRV